MAMEAGVYMYLWRPDELGITRAGDIVGALEVGLEELINNPEHFRKFNSPNGWGLYCHFVPFVKDVLHACEQNPDAKIEVSR
jgi:hypothetical protein